jgi:uncharacterized Tic20 family protein
MSNGTEPGAPAPPAGEPGLSKEERTWAMAAVLSPLCGFVIPIPFVNIIIPLVIYFMKRDESAFVAFHALQSVYFQIVVFVAALISIILIFVCIGVLLLVVVGIGAIVYMVMIAIKAYDGQWAEYWLVGKWARDAVKR